MSKGRMNDLLDSLKADGWRHLNPDSMFEIENEVVHWEIEHVLTRANLDLDFHIFGELGESSDSLLDILYCVVRGTSVKLYFEKRESKRWKDALCEFVSALGRISSNSVNDTD